MMLEALNQQAERIYHKSIRHFTPFEDLSHLVQDEMAEMQALFESHIGSPINLISDIGTYLLASGGKKIRPMLTLAVGKLMGVPHDGLIQLATCVELLHTATLLHDDVIDCSTHRRGKVTAHTIWGNKASVLVGDYLLSLSFRLMVDLGHIEVLKTLSQTATRIMEGELLQLEKAYDAGLEHDDYFNIINAKTAKLFETACSIPAIWHEFPANECKALGDYGHYLGIAYQIIDDALDYDANEKELGKCIGDDFREGKVTFPILYAYKNGTPEERRFWQRTINQRTQNPEDFEQACQILMNHNVAAVCRDMAESTAAKATLALESLNNPQLKNLLNSLIAFVIMRNK